MTGFDSSRDSDVSLKYKIKIHGYDTRKKIAKKDINLLKYGK